MTWPEGHLTSDPRSSVGYTCRSTASYEPWIRPREQREPDRTMTQQLVSRPLPIGLLLALVCLLAAGSAQGNDPPQIPDHPHFDHLTADDGLPENSVRALLEDRLGFLWIGTQNGLVCYDGHEMKVFQPIVGDTTSIGGRNITSLHEDPWGYLWVGTTSGGVSRYDPRTQVFTNFVSTVSRLEALPGRVVSAIASAPDSTLWIALQDGGLGYLLPGQSRFRPARREPLDSSAAANDSLMAVHVADDGTVWFGYSTGGVGTYDPRRQIWQTYLRPDDESGSMAGGRVNDIFQDHQGRLWFASNLGLARWNRDRRDFTRFVPVPQEPESWANYMVRIDEDPGGRLWIGSAVGLYLYDPDRDVFRLFAHEPGRSSSIGEGPVLSVLCDRAGTIWTGGWQAGVNSLDPWRNKFGVLQHEESAPGTLDQNAVVCVLEDRDRNLWLGTGGVSGVNTRGVLNCRRYGSPDFFQITFPDSADVQTVLSLCEAPNGDLWIGTDEGLWYLERGDVRIRRPSHPDLSTERSGLTTIYSICLDDDLNLWLGSFGAGLRVLLSTTDEVIEYANDPADPGSLSQNRVTRIHCDPRGRIWVGTSTAGLNLFSPETGTFLRLLDPRVGLATITDIRDAGDDQVFVSTGAGLFRVDAQGNTESVLSNGRGMSDVAVASILRDDLGHLWVYTVQGMVQLDLRDGQERFYDKTDGVPGGELYFGGGRDREGTLYFGSKHGLVVVRPELSRDNPYIPPVRITGLDVGDEPLAPSLLLEQQSTFPFVERITLPHDSNDLKFHFTSLHLARPNRNQYRYRLDEYDADWHEAGFRSTATYTNLDPGSYTFRVLGSNADGVWNEVGAQLQVLIHPPWWRTHIALGLYILATLGLTLLIYRQIVNRERIRTALEIKRAEARHLQKLDRMRSRFFTNISHEFRTPLTLILGPLRRLQEQSQGADRQACDMMERNAVRLGALIDQLLDLSRLESGRMPLRWVQRDCSAWFRSLLAAFDSLARDRGITLEVDVSTETRNVWFEPDLLEKITVNLLSNALKFTPDGGRVVTAVSTLGNLERLPVPRQIGELETGRTADARFLQITVANSGSYIAPSERNRIFERFQQLASDSSSAGSGIGLSLTRELVDLLGGNIRVDSDRATGTCFTVSVPVYLEPPAPAETDGSEWLEATRPTSSVDRASIELGRGALADKDAPADDEVPARISNVLVVEDNPDLREFLKSELASDYSVLQAENGAAGLALALEEIPDLVISDVMMPEMDGFELCRALKENERTSHIPVILLTARVEIESRLTGLTLGADDYLAKPFDSRELLARVANLVEQRRNLQEQFSRNLADLEPAAMPVTSAEERFVKRAREVVEAHLDDSDFSVELFSREMGLSRAHLLRKLRSLTNMTPRDFIRTHRLQRAAQLLAGGYGNVTEISYAVGIMSLSTFAKRFKEQYGVSPSDYARGSRVTDSPEK